MTLTQPRSRQMTLTLPRPHEAQRAVLAGARRYNVLCMGRRWGKSTLGIDRLIGPALAGKPSAWFSPTFPMLTEIWRETLRVLAPVLARKNEQQKRIELITGGVIDFWSLDNPDSARGRKYARVVVDEAAMIRGLEEAWQQAIRPTLADFVGDAWFLSTPKGRNFFWELFQRGQDPEQPEWVSWQMPTATNPYIRPSEVAAMRLEMPATAFNQEVLAQFLEIGGRFFDEWEEARHTMPARDVPGHWHFFGGLDSGTAAPFAFHLCAADEQGAVQVIGEVYKAGLLPEAQASLVRALLDAKGVQPVNCLIAADPAMFPPQAEAERLGEYPIEAFWRAGLTCVRGINKRLPGWVRVKEFLHRPGAFRVHWGSCPNLVRTAPLMVYDERPGHLEDMDTTLEDHAWDSLRYALMTRPRPAGPAPSVPTASAVAGPNGQPVRPLTHVPHALDTSDEDEENEW